MKRIEGEWRYFDESLNIPYPWYTKGCLEFLETLDLKGKRVFEYGVGESTTWYLEKGAICFGVDNSIEWANYTGSKFAVFNNEYVGAIDEYGLFDIVVVDGAWRDDCVEWALPHMKEGGILIIDNFEQPEVEPNIWTKTKELIRQKKHEIHFELDHGTWKTLVVTI